MFGLRCRAPMTTSRSRSGKMPRTWDISSSVGALMVVAPAPPCTLPARPVSSSTHARITEGFEGVSPDDGSRSESSDGVGKAGATAVPSAEWLVRVWRLRAVAVALRSSEVPAVPGATPVDRLAVVGPATAAPAAASSELGSPRFERLGGLREPTRGSKIVRDIRTTLGESLYDLSPARSDR